MITYVLLENGLYGIYSEDENIKTNIFTEENKIVNKKNPQVPYEIINYRRVPHLTQRLLKDILHNMHEIIKIEKEQKRLLTEIEDMEKAIEDARKNRTALESSKSPYNKANAKLCKEYKESKRMKELAKSITGTEVCGMSFYSGTLDRAKAKVIIQKSSRPLSYTYGFSYRNPTTNHVPKTMEQAFEIIDNESYLDITFSENEIHLNAFSGNDMW